MPPALPLVHPFVKSAMIKNGLIELTIEFDRSDSGSYVEVSGSATQTGGAYANFYDVAEVPAVPSDTNDQNPSVKVSAHALPPGNFMKDQDVTCVIRTGKVWLTVLGRQGSSTEQGGTDLTAGENTIWNDIKQVSHIADDDKPLNETGGS